MRYLLQRGMNGGGLIEVLKERAEGMHLKFMEIENIRDLTSKGKGIGLYDPLLCWGVNTRIDEKQYYGSLEFNLHARDDFLFPVRAIISKEYMDMFMWLVNLTIEVKDALAMVK